MTFSFLNKCIKNLFPKQKSYFEMQITEWNQGGTNRHIYLWCVKNVTGSVEPSSNSGLFHWVHICKEAIKKEFIPSHTDYGSTSREAIKKETSPYLLTQTMAQLAGKPLRKTRVHCFIHEYKNGYLNKIKWTYIRKYNLNFQVFYWIIWNLHSVFIVRGYLRETISFARKLVSP